MASSCQKGNSSEKRGIKRRFYDADDNSIEQELVSDDLFIEGNFNYDDLFKEGSFNYDDLFKEDSINGDEGSKEKELNDDDVSKDQSEVKTYEAVKKSRNKKFRGLSVEEADHLRLKFNKEQRERNKGLAEGYEALRKLNLPPNPRLSQYKENSKIHVLNNTIDYIQELQDIIRVDDMAKGINNSSQVLAFLPNMLDGNISQNGSNACPIQQPIHLVTGPKTSAYTSNMIDQPTQQQAVQFTINDNLMQKSGVQNLIISPTLMQHSEPHTLTIALDKKQQSGPQTLPNVLDQVQHAGAQIFTFIPSQVQRFLPIVPNKKQKARPQTPSLVPNQVQQSGIQTIPIMTNQLQLALPITLNQVQQSWPQALSFLPSHVQQSVSTSSPSSMYQPVEETSSFFSKQAQQSFLNTSPLVSDKMYPQFQPPSSLHASPPVGNQTYPLSQHQSSLYKSNFFAGQLQCQPNQDGWSHGQLVVDNYVNNSNSDLGQAHSSVNIRSIHPATSNTRKSRRSKKTGRKQDGYLSSGQTFTSKSTEMSPSTTCDQFTMSLVSNELLPNINGGPETSALLIQSRSEQLTQATVSLQSNLHSQSPAVHVATDIPDEVQAKELQKDDSLQPRPTLILSEESQNKPASLQTQMSRKGPASPQSLINVQNEVTTNSYSSNLNVENDVILTTPDFALIDHNLPDLNPRLSSSNSDNIVSANDSFSSSTDAQDNDLQTFLTEIFAGSEDFQNSDFQSDIDMNLVD
ncbi:hypothetical protein Bpfe_007363 [Biomphalaria pfeifferi]|uniref:BHLH domain-containing protein n=1 Tax=Biomphalaria pfeifferi TaxID=112525 RepID=A0AAD8FFK3_BIOPF|nr:hypothetical protein Bpfe_007363 [Biomphalaria pfeifferi]